MGMISLSLDDITTLGGGAMLLQTEAIEEMEDGKVLAVAASNDCKGADVVTTFC